jgi:hypothetical protein
VEWLGDTPLVNTVCALAELSDETLIGVGGGGIRLDQAVFLGHRMKLMTFDTPGRRADFQRATTAGWEELAAGQSEQCGRLSDLPADALMSARCCRKGRCELGVYEDAA